MKIKTSNTLCIVSLILGSTAMLGHIIGNKALKGFGLATSAAPYTKVFCQAQTTDGKLYETFAASFTIQFTDDDGNIVTKELTPEMYQNFTGPYNRRNVYGAVLAYGPALPKALQQHTLYYALHQPGSIAKELDLPVDVKNFSIVIKSKTHGSPHQWVLQSNPFNTNSH